MKKMIKRLHPVVCMTRVALHLIAGCAIVGLVYPWIDRERRLILKCRWSHRLLDLFGITLQAHGSPQAGLRVANHVSWLDIFALNAASPGAFVAKADVRQWPVIGWLSSRTDTMFMRRGSHRAAHVVIREIADWLLAGNDVTGFPEGTTSEGHGVSPFHGALLQGAMEAGTPIQPVVLRYECQSGRLTTVPAYCGETSLLQSMWHIAQADRMVVQLVYLPARSPVKGLSRRDLAKQLRADILETLDQLEDMPRPVVSRAGAGSGEVISGDKSGTGEDSLGAGTLTAAVPVHLTSSS